MLDARTAEPEVGQLVRVRGEQWLVTEIDRSRQAGDELSTTALPGRTIVRLANVSGDDLGESLAVVWDVQPGREVLPPTAIPVLDPAHLNDPETFGAFLDTVRWGTVADADTATMQAPFRAGITIEPYQLAPVARALSMPRVNLLIADDVGLGKTIEAGLVARELLLRHRARRILVVCPASLPGKWRDEMLDKFGLEFTVLDAEAIRALRRSHGQLANPFTVYPRMIISLPWLRSPRVQRLLDEVLSERAAYVGFFDLMIVDEAHHCAPSAPPRADGRPRDSLQTAAVRRVGRFAAHRLFLSATPHNGYSRSWQALLEMLDPQRFTQGVEPDPKALADVVIRRLKDDLVDESGQPLFPGRATAVIEVEYSEGEQHMHRLLAEYLRRRPIVGRRAARTPGAHHRCTRRQPAFCCMRTSSCAIRRLGFGDSSTGAGSGCMLPRRMSNAWCGPLCGSRISHSWSAAMMAYSNHPSSCAVGSAV